MKTEELQRVNAINVYDYLFDFIWQATLLTDKERENWEQIEALIKSRKIKNCMDVMKTQVKVKSIMDNKTEFLKLLTPGEKRVVQEFINQTPSKDIPLKLDISDKSYSVYLSSIYKKTQNLVCYGKRIKMPALYKYLFDTLKFQKGEVIIEPKKKTINSTSKKKANFIVKEFGNSTDLINSFTQVKTCIREKLDGLILDIGKAVLQQGKDGLENNLTYVWAKRYEIALKVLEMENARLCKKVKNNEVKNENKN